MISKNFYIGIDAYSISSHKYTVMIKGYFSKITFYDLPKEEGITIIHSDGMTLINTNFIEVVDSLFRNNIFAVESVTMFPMQYQHLLFDSVMKVRTMIENGHSGKYVIISQNHSIRKFYQLASYTVGDHTYTGPFEMTEDEEFILRMSLPSDHRLMKLEDVFTMTVGDFVLPGNPHWEEIRMKM